MTLSHKISAAERDWIVSLLASRPLPEVRRATGRSLKTLLRIAEVAL